MRVSIGQYAETLPPHLFPAAPPPATAVVTAPAPDPSVPDLRFLSAEFATALQSFFATMQRLVADNPVAIPRLQELAGKARQGGLTPEEATELQLLKLQALRQGKAVAAGMGFFLKFKPYPMLEEIRSRAKLFQPAFGPVLVVEGNAVRELLERDQEFTVEPYGVEMQKVMSPAHNGGFTTFILSTDDTARYEPDKRLLTSVCTREDAEAITELIHQDCVRRVGTAVAAARAAGSSTIDVVQTVARYVPVTLGHRYLGVPVAPVPGTFDLTPEMLTYYGAPIDGQATTALTRSDGVIPDEAQMYAWIKAAFQHFFNNVQKDPVVSAQGLRACRQLLAYLLREIGIQRQRLQGGHAVDDTMLTRLLRVQLGMPVPGVVVDGLDPRLVSDLRIAENVMGTIVGAVAGQEEATCRAIDALLRLKEGQYATAGGSQRYGNFDEARQLALNVLDGSDVATSRGVLYRYAMEALRLEPQGEVLLRKCVKDGATIAGSRPMTAGTLVFAAHGSAMKDVPEPGAFVLDRPREHWLTYGWNRHTCLGQHVSPVIIVGSMVALLGLEDLRRPEPGAGDKAFPLERRFGRLQLDDQNLYAASFAVQFTDSGTTQRFWPVAAN
jgi:cytochrome P450